MASNVLFRTIDASPQGLLRLYTRMLLLVGGMIFVVHALVGLMGGFDGRIGLLLGLDVGLLVMAFIAHEHSEGSTSSTKVSSRGPMLFFMGAYQILLCFETGGLGSPYFVLLLMTCVTGGLILSHLPAILNTAALGAVYSFAAWTTPEGIFGGGIDGIAEALRTGRRMTVDEVTGLVLNGALLFLGGYIANRGAATFRTQITTLADRATRDPLTRLPNRRGFLEKMENELSRAARYAWPISILMIDLDHFKRINDQYGHAFGDTVLAHSAELLRDTVGPMDHLARMGGEEFAVAAIAADPNHGADLAARIVRRFRAYNWGALVPGLEVTCSVGVAALPPSQMHAAPDHILASLLEESDLALYAVKQNGRNDYHVSTERLRVEGSHQPGHQPGPHQHA